MIYLTQLNKGGIRIMMLYVDSFVTVIVIKLGLFGSRIVDERHFSTFESAEAYADTVDVDDSIIVVTEV